MPTSLNPRSIRRDTPHVVAATPHVVSRASARAAASARGTANGENATNERRATAHTAHTAFVHHCEYCRNERDNALERNHLASLTQRNVKPANATPHVGDKPRAMSAKVRTHRNITSPVLTGDRTRNGTPRRVRATQRYATNDTTANVGDTVLTNERDNVRHVRRNPSPLIVRNAIGGVDTQSTLYVLAHYRYLIGCRNPSETKGN